MNLFSMLGEGHLMLLALGVLFIYIYMYGDEQTGGLSPATIANKYNDPYYARQYRELDDVNNVLNRPIRQGKTHIQQLQSMGIGESSKPSQLQVAPLTYLDLEAGDYITDSTPKDVLTMVEGRQPYFFSEPVVIDYCGRKFYWTGAILSNHYQ